MTAWQQFLVQHGAQLDAATPGDINFNGAPEHEASLPDFVTPLLDRGLIALSGDEAAHFLHNQLTNDVEHLGANDARLAGYCSPKGRLLATFLMWKSADGIMLQLPRELQAAIQKRLQMFVMRAKAKLNDVTDEVVLLGLAGNAVATALAPWWPQLPSAPYQSMSSEHGTLIRLADALDAPRYQWITSATQAMAVWPQLTKTLTPAGSNAWKLRSIHAGIPDITLATQEQFVPQMINYEAIGGVNFKKGCYPGQEIVARSQYLGKLKRRMQLATIVTQTAAAGTEVFSSADPEQPCGKIVNSALRTATEIDCLVELKLAAIDAGSIHLGSADGPTLQFQPLPYALPDPE